MNESGERRALLASALLLFDPRLRKYQDPRLYDLHVAGDPTQVWKARLRSKIAKAADHVIDDVLVDSNMIILFDRPNLTGNIVMIPLEGEFPLSVSDQVMLRKYIKWDPPSSMISAIVPKDYRVEFTYENGAAIMYLEEGLTRSFVIPEPIAGVRILKRSTN